MTIASETTGTTLSGGKKDYGNLHEILDKAIKGQILSPEERDFAFNLKQTIYKHFLVEMRCN